jgi:hypothetical protein
MSETGLICQYRPPNPADYAGLDRDLAKSIASNFNIFFYESFKNKLRILKNGIL